MSGCAVYVLFNNSATLCASDVRIRSVDGVQVARKNMLVNGFDDRVTVVQGKLEDIQLPVQKVTSLFKPGNSVRFESTGWSTSDTW